MDAVTANDVRKGAAFKTDDGYALTITNIRRAPQHIWIDYSITDPRGRTWTQKRKLRNFLAWHGLRKA